MKRSFRLSPAGGFVHGLQFMPSPLSPCDSTGDQPAPGDRFGWVVLCGITSLALYLLLPGFFARLTSSEPSFAFQVFPWLKAVTKESLAPLRGQPDNFHVSAPFLASVAALFGLYAAVFKLVKGNRSLRLQAVLFASGAIFLGAFLFSPVMLSTDVFAYAFYGRILSVYHSDAYSLAAVYSPTDPYLLLFGHKFFGSVYGPVWTLFSAGITALTGENVGLTVFFFRLLAALSILTGAGLIWNILRRQAPDTAAQGLVLFLWNPLVITEAAGGCHNDAILVALLLFGVWLHTRGWKAGALVAMTLAALLKVIAAPVILLYVWAVLRESPLWRDRLRFLARAGTGALVTVALAFTLAQAKEKSPVSKFSSAPDFYLNNYHDLVFKGLRRILGEDAESVQIPMDFGGWWMEAKADNVLYHSPSPSSPKLRTVKEGELVLVVAPQLTEWMRVYDPASRQKGWMLSGASKSLPTLLNPAPDEESARLQVGPLKWPTVELANKLLRGAMLTLFAAFGLLAAWRTTHFNCWSEWACAVMSAICLTVATQIWPWYAIWGLALGALKPGSAPARLAVCLSIGMSTLYAMLGFGFSKFHWLYDLRSVPAVLLPVAAWLVWMISKKSDRLDAGLQSRILHV